MMLQKKISTIDGVGIFTNNNISESTIFYKVNIAKTSSFPKPKRAYIGKNTRVSDPILDHINHSCDPNSKLDISNKKPHLIATKNILSGEEITVKYDETEIGGEEITCTCLSKNCKGYFLRIE